MAGQHQDLLTQYMGLLILMGVAALVCGGMVTLSWVLGPKNNTPYKSSPYECGVAPVGDARERFPIKFYLVAILFILFDIEVVFLWGWMTVFRHESGDKAFMTFTYIELLTYMATWLLGYAYAIRVGAIDWDETTGLEPAVTAIEPNGRVMELVPPESALVGVGGGTK